MWDANGPRRSASGAAATQALSGAPSQPNGTFGPQIQRLFRTAFALGMGDTLTVFAAIVGAGVLVSLLFRRSDFAVSRITLVQQGDPTPAGTSG